jgi:hypothetical protein
VSRIHDAVPDGRSGGDDRGLPELAAEAADGDGVGERVGVLVPDPFEEVLGAEEGGAGMPLSVWGIDERNALTPGG